MKLRGFLTTAVLGISFLIAPLVMNEVNARQSSAIPASSVTSLLHGCTVSATNTISCAIPAGWQVVTCEGFEGGKLHNTCNGAAEKKVPALGTGTTISCTFGHTSKCSATSLVNAQGAGPALFSGNGSFGTVYISYWEWKDANASMNDEMFITDLQHRVSGILQQEIIIDRFNSNGSGGTQFNSAFDGVLIESQGSVTGHVTGDIFGPATPFAAGTWYQWEVLYHPRKCGRMVGGERCRGYELRR